MLHKKQLDPLIDRIVKDSIRPRIDITVREIAQEVCDRTGYLPSTSVVRYSLERLGIATDGVSKRWIYKHKRSHE